MLRIDHIVSKYTIGNTLDIKVRVKDQGNFPWVSVSCYSTYCDVTFTSDGVSGKTLVVLQSYDDNSSVKSTLKEDSVEVCFDCISFSRPTTLAPTYHLPVNNLYEIEVAHLQPNPAPTVPIDVMMREKSGTEQGFVTIENLPSE